MNIPEDYAKLLEDYTKLLEDYATLKKNGSKPGKHS